MMTVQMKKGFINSAISHNKEMLSQSTKPSFSFRGLISHKCNKTAKSQGVAKSGVFWETLISS